MTGFNFQIENLDVSDIIANIDSSVKELNSEEAKRLAPEITAENITAYKMQISACINILQQAKVLRKRIFNSGNLTEDFTNNLLDNDISKNITMALKNGLIIIDNLQRQAGKGVDYKIVIAGKQLYEANIPLKEVLEGTTTTFRDKDGGFGLKLTYTKKQIQDAITMIESNKTNIIENNILSKMKKVQLNNEENVNAARVWEVLRASKNRLARITKRQSLIMRFKQDKQFWSPEFKKIVGKENDEKKFIDFIKQLSKMQLSDIKISSHKINEGQLIEAFYEYYLNMENYANYDINQSALYLNLFEKSKNVLGHQYGGDAGGFQIKALNSNSQEAIATIATISNVLQPLENILKELNQAEGNISKALENAFNQAGNTDRNFKEDAKKIVEEQIKKSLGIK